MRLNVLILTLLFLAACDTIPLRHIDEVELKAARGSMNLSIEEQRNSNLKKVDRAAKAIGLKEKPCGAYTYSTHDVSPRALTYGSRLLGMNPQNAQCYSICLEKNHTYMKEQNSCIDTRTVTQVDPFNPQVVKVEMWTPVPTKEAELISKKMSELLLSLKK
ncbi:MAG: hypothetical protein AB7F59_00400 [Bdellovibrionales bacterium]